MIEVIAVAAVIGLILAAVILTVVFSLQRGTALGIPQGSTVKKTFGWGLALACVVFLLFIMF